MMESGSEQPAADAREGLTTATTSPSPQRGLLWMLLFWIVVMGMVYVLMQKTLAPKYPQASAGGAVEIKRSLDGHFRTIGQVNGVDTVFLLDTGATTVAVSDEFAARAALHGGTRTEFNTANGVRSGRMVDGITIAVGPLEVRNTRVGVGISPTGDDEALLGQSFLRHFDVSISGATLILRPRS